MKTMITFFLIVFMVTEASARVEERGFENKEQEQRYHVLIDELRCLVCQNQNLAGSNAELAQDLRDQVYLMIKRGDSNEVIIDFMVSRYGDFVLYRPPLKNTTLMLWAGPFVIFLVALLVMGRFIHKRQQVNPPEISQSDRDKVRKILDDEDDDK